MKIKEVIKRKNFTTIKPNSNLIGTYIIDKRNVSDSNIYHESKGLQVGSTGLKLMYLAKMEIL